MCFQLKVLKKIQAKGRINGYDMELAEAQAKDFIRLNDKITTLEQEFKAFRMDLDEIKTNQQVMSGNIQLIVQRLNGPVDEERRAGAVLSEFKGIVKSWKAWVLMILVIMAIALAGEKLLQLLSFVPTGYAG